MIVASDTAAVGLAEAERLAVETGACMDPWTTRRMDDDVQNVLCNVNHWVQNILRVKSIVFCVPSNARLAHKSAILSTVEHNIKTHAGQPFILFFAHANKTVDTIVPKPKGFAAFRANSSTGQRFAPQSLASVKEATAFVLEESHSPALYVCSCNVR